MAANLITKLVLQDAEFAKKLEKNKKQVSAFGKGGAQAFGTVASVVGKFAAGVGVAMGGVEAFNKVMNSSQTLADAWGGVMESAKSTVDSFFYSISNGDWSPFFGGLDGIISRAREAYAAMDDLGNVTMSYNYAQAQDNAKLTELLNTARDESLGVDVRNAAMKEAKALAASMQKDAATYNKTIKEAYLKELAGKVGVDDSSIFTREMLEKALRLDISGDRGKLRESLSGSKAAYDAEIAGLTVKKETRNIFGQKDVEWEKVANYDARVAEIQKRYADTLVQWAALEVASDEQLNSIGQAVIAGENAVRNAANAEKTLQRAQKTLQTAVAKAAQGVTAPAAVDTSAATDWNRAFADNDKHQENKKARLAEMGIPETLGEIPTMKVSDEAKESVRDYADEITQLGSAFGQLGSAVGGAEGEMLAWIGSAMSAAAQVAETIALLSAETAAHTANANAAATDAAAKAMAANAGIPIAGVAMGIAAVASIISVLSSIPKFATGGIVTGPTVGLVGEAGPEAIIPLSKLDKMMASGGAREVRVVGTLKARGKDLVGTITNFNNAQNVYG